MSVGLLVDVSFIMSHAIPIVVLLASVLLGNTLLISPFWIHAAPRLLKVSQLAVAPQQGT